MKISLNWIKEYTDIILPPEELKERVSVSLTEVEAIENFGEKYEDIIVCEVVSVKPHPKSDNLLVLKVNTGTVEVDVVVQQCDVAVGDKVPYLKPGTVLPYDEIKISKLKIKGVMSEGFVPSGMELSLNSDHTTVYKLPSDIKIGADFAQTLKLVDQVMEIKNKALTHRPDTFSVEGMAREIAAIQGTDYKRLDWLYDPEMIKPQKISTEVPIKIDNKAKALCKRYMAVVIDDVKVKPSPVWMQIRLIKMGIRPVNNIVDISNYLMLEAGQPNHAFDYDKVVLKDPGFEGTAVITVRLAEAGEKITTLDGQQHELGDSVIVIADSTNPIGIAGVMGGKDTEISNETTKVVFQVENLDMYSIRRASMSLGIFTDAVTRFSKGLDPNRCEPVMYRGIQMIQELAGGTVVSEIVDDKQELRREYYVTISTDALCTRLGIKIETEEIVNILRRLELIVNENGGSQDLVIKIPTFRPDLRIPEDIYEEVVRLYGYDRVTPTLPVRKTHPVVDDKSRENVSMIKRILKSLGANELYTYSFIGRSLYESCNLSVQKCHKLLNPISSDLKYMRPYIVPSLLSKVTRNTKHYEELALFEVNQVNPLKPEKKAGKKLASEPYHVGLIHTLSYYHAKLYLETLMNALGLADFEILQPDKINKEVIPDWLDQVRSMYHPGRTGLIRFGKDFVGLIGQIDIKGVSELDLPEYTSGFEINLHLLDDSILDIHQYSEISKYPSVVQDFCFVTDSDVPYSALLTAVKKSDKEGLIRDVNCVDIYRASDIKDLKQCTLRISMQSSEKTLTEREIDALRSGIIKGVEADVGGKLLGK
ncbi:MAG: phenylalanine--tRNA ligase subunit beta [Patescibacteria group bacterium]|nr:phenylalanine--tRNA ligase subunit beta [Patescibacteria group bacterium]